MLLLGALQQFDIDLPAFLVHIAYMGFVLFFSLAALCAPLLAVKAETAFLPRSRAFYDKIALQTAEAAVALHIYLLSILGLSLFVVMYLYQPHLTYPLFVQYALVLFAPFAAGLFLSGAYLLLWNPLRKKRAPHLAAGYIAALYSLALLFLGFLLLPSARPLLLLQSIWANPVPVLRLLLADFLASPVLWLGLGCLFFTGLAAGSGLAQIWLIIRRERAAYGRDYYAFAMRYQARVALFYALVSTLLAGAFFHLLRQSVPPELSQSPDLGVMLVAFGLPLCSGLIWLSIGKSDTPLRHKAGAVFACLFLFIALCAQLLLLASAFPQM